MNAKMEPSFVRLPSLELPFGAALGTTFTSRKKPLNRHIVIATVVVSLHVAFVWALQSGLLMRAAEQVVPVEILTQLIAPPAPKTEPKAEPTPPKPQAQTPPVKKAATPPARQPAPQPLAIADPTPSSNAPVGVTTPQPGPTPVTAPVAPSTAVVAATAPMLPTTAPTVQLPSSDADYLQNPSPPYPPISKRLSEQGKTTVRVLIGIDGLPQRSEVAKSSGFERLDQAALTTVMRWRFVPGKRGGVPEAMWFNVPINWVLQ